MLKNVCRICGRYASKKESLNIFDHYNTELLVQIKDITGLQIEFYECLPELICECCQRELRDAVKFRERCISAQDDILRSLTEKERYTILTNSKSTLSTDTSIDGQLVECTLKAEEFITIEKEYEEILIPEPFKTIPPTTVDIIEQTEICKYQSAEDDDNDEDAEMLDIIDVLEGHDETKSVDSSPIQLNVKTKGGKQISCIFVCDECGKHIRGRKAFELHCRRHRGEKDCECEICHDRFFTTSELKRHMRKHTGERPFACQHCNRRFTDYSTRLKHERTHTNERPYRCLDCGKAFTTAYILKNHMLIHSGERAFRCDLCDKSFMRSTHLITHYRSSAHKRSVQNKEDKKFS